LTPGEPAFPDEKKRIGEIVERDYELFDSDDQFLRGDTAFAGLDRRYRLAVFEAEKAREMVLRDRATP
jgi:hypothetical protein